MAIKLKRPLPEIPTASMADIAFLLIIFFMLTAVYSSNFGLEYGLPKNEDLAGSQGDQGRRGLDGEPEGL